MRIIRCIPITVFALLLVLLGPMAIDIYLPAMSKMAEYFQHDVRASIGIFTFGIGIGQLLFGPFSDHYGRRATALTGINIYAFSAVAIYFWADTLSVLLSLRLLQGLGASATAVACNAMIRDSFDGVKASQRYSLLAAMLNIVPALAPLLGAMILSYWNWRATFIFLAVYAFVAGLIMVLAMPETRIKRALHERPIAWSALIRHRSLLVYTLCCCSAVILILNYVTSAAPILIDQVGLSEKVFALYFGVNASIAIVGNLLAARLVMYIHPKQLLKVGLILWLIAGILLLVLHPYNTVWAFMLPVATMTMGFPLILGPANSLAMHSFKKNAGRAAAFIGASQMLIASSSVIVLSMAPWDAKYSLGLLAMILPCLCFWAVSQHQERSEDSLHSD